MKRRRPRIPITDPAFKWDAPDADSKAFWERQRDRIERIQGKQYPPVPEPENVAPIKKVRTA